VRFKLPKVPHVLNTTSSAANLSTKDEYWFDRTCKKIKVALAWDEGCDVDISVALMDKKMELLDTVHYKKQTSSCNSVTHSGDDETGEGDGNDESVRVRLRDIPQRVTHLLFFAIVYSKGKSLTDVRNCTMSAYMDKTTQQPLLFKYPITPPANAKKEINAMCVSMLTRIGAFFKLTALATPCRFGRVVSEVMKWNPIVIPPILEANPPRANLRREVYVGAERAKNLYPQDHSLIGSGSADPFVVFQLRKTKLITNWITKNLNPSWNQDFHRPLGIVDAAESKPLLVLVYDHDNASDDDFMGGVSIPGSAVYNLGPGKHRLKLKLNGTISHELNAFKGLSEFPDPGIIYFSVELQDLPFAF